MEQNTEKPADWLWYGVDANGLAHVSFGRWQRHTCQQRYDLTTELPTEKRLPNNALGAAIDRYERACMAYERLGNMKRDDAKTRELRKDILKEYGESRADLIRHLTQGSYDEHDAVLEERRRCARIAKYHTHHALWFGLPVTLMTETEPFGIALAQRIEQAILEPIPAKKDAGDQRIT